MYVLGIESTAHTFGAGIVADGKVIANERDTYKPKKGGIIPREAAEHHHELAPSIIKNALAKAGIKISDIDVFAFSQGPGILACLRVGTQIARFFSSKFNKKLIGVNHCIAHIEIARGSTGFDDPVMLYVSGGNTQVLTFESGRYRVFGETQDIGVGNLLDKFGRHMGFPFPAGPVIEELAKKGKNYVKIPYSIKGMDVSFGGIDTFLSKAVKDYAKEDLCYSLQETAFAMLIEASERTIAYCGKNSFVVTGGVAANQRLNDMGRIMCEDRSCNFKQIPRDLSGDNGAMIAYTGYLMRDYIQDDLKPRPNFRTDMVEVKYR